MALSKITTNSIASGNITAALIPDGSITGSKIASQTIGLSNMAGASGVVRQYGGSYLTTSFDYTCNWSGHQNKGPIGGSDGAYGMKVTMTPLSTNSYFIIDYTIATRKGSMNIGFYFEPYINGAIQYAGLHSGTVMGSSYTGHRYSVNSDGYNTHQLRAVFKATSTSAHTFQINCQIYDENTGTNASFHALNRGTYMSVMEVI